jgi:hypothetical protein
MFAHLVAERSSLIFDSMSEKPGCISTRERPDTSTYYARVSLRLLVFRRLMRRALPALVDMTIRFEIPFPVQPSDETLIRWPW